MNLISLAQDLLLNQKKEKAQDKIVQVLAPILGSCEVPTIQDPEEFGRIAKPLWESTGVNNLKGLLSGDTSYRSSWELEQLKTVPDFVVEKSQRLESGSTWVAFADPSLARWTSSDEFTNAVPGTLWANFDKAVTERISDYIGELSSVLSEIQSVQIPSYGLYPGNYAPDRSGLAYASWQLPDYYTLLASSYISWLFYVHQKLETGALDCFPELETTSTVCTAKNSNGVTPQSSKRPPPSI